MNAIDQAADAHVTPDRDAHTLLDITVGQARINRNLGAGAVFGDVGERIAAHLTGSHRVSGKGRDLARRSERDWVREEPHGLAAPGPQLVPHRAVLDTWSTTDQARFHAWRDRSAVQLGEVKTRQARYPLDGTAQYPLDTRSGGPATPFFPLVDFYVFVLFNPDGAILMCRKLTLAEVVEHAATRNQRGGSWNYKIAIHTGMTLGEDITDAANSALETLVATPEAKSTLVQLAW